MPRRRTLAEGIPALRSLRAACAFALRAALTGEAVSRGTGDPSLARLWTGRDGWDGWDGVGWRQNDHPRLAPKGAYGPEKQVFNESCVDDSCRDDYHADMTKVKPSKSVRAGEKQAAQPRRFDSLEQEAYLNLWRTYDRLKALEEGVFSEFDLSAQQYNALRLLRDASPESLPTLVLAARLVSRAPDITRLVDRLEARGLVGRERLAHNRRVVRIAITPQGEALLDRMAERIVACGTQQLGHLSPADLTALIDLLKAARRPHEVGEAVAAIPASTT